MAPPAPPVPAPLQSNVVQPSLLQNIIENCSILNSKPVSFADLAKTLAKTPDMNAVYHSFFIGYYSKVDLPREFFEDSLIYDTNSSFLKNFFFIILYYFLIIFPLEMKTFGLVLEFEMWRCGINQTLS